MCCFDVIVIDLRLEMILIWVFATVSIFGVFMLVVLVV